MGIKFFSIYEYIAYVFKKCGELQSIQNTFRVAAVKQTATEAKIIFQIIGKATFMECSPAEILSNEAFMERFSRKDIQKIIYAQVQYENKTLQKEHELKLAQQEFNIESNKTKFFLKDTSGSITSKTAAEIALDKSIINKLSQQDAINIGYIAGYEYSQNNSIKESKVEK